MSQVLVNVQQGRDNNMFPGESGTFKTLRVFGQVPTKCTGVPDGILNPANQWKDAHEFDANLSHLADLYMVRDNICNCTGAQ